MVSLHELFEKGKAQKADTQWSHTRHLWHEMVAMCCFYPCDCSPADRQVGRPKIDFKNSISDYLFDFNTGYLMLDGISLFCKGDFRHV